MNRKIAIAGLYLLFSTSFFMVPAQSKSKPADKFRQLEEVLPTPNAYRTASGSPGHRYWQQRADVTMNIVLDDEKQHIFGSETIVYTNHSPDTLTYLWLQLDQNRFARNSDDKLTRAPFDFEDVNFKQVLREINSLSFDGGFRIASVRDKKNNPLSYTIVKTMMRIDLTRPLPPGGQTVFSIEWDYPIVDHNKLGGRAGYEYFEKDGNYIYEIAQFFPRMAAYTDANGWQHKQFLGDGEFTLEFGDYHVSITVPADHIVAATGVLENPEEVLTRERRKRLKQAETSEKTIFVVTPGEAKEAEENRAKDTKTWVFHANNVRDFAFASSRKFIWDAQGHPRENGTVMAMSFYPNEGNPLWERYSTHAIIHTLEHYAKYTFTYPYPVAQSVNGPVGGMEYPMICFNGPRPEEDGTWSPRAKYGLISVVIHEVGHNFFPMIVNTDERQWTWMDEGLNSFLQFLAEQGWEENYPSKRGEPAAIVTYMASEEQLPIMTNSESLLQFGNNAYAKPATALNILRETILGRDLFDFAFREFARRWRFKRPMPADFFRTMEDASGVDLDWFWRGWFYSTDHTDIAISGLHRYRVDTLNPDLEKPIERELKKELTNSITDKRNQSLARRVDRFPELLDFYNENDAFTVTEGDRREYQAFLEKLTDQERAILADKLNFYVVDFENIGGLIMPIILEIEYEDGAKEMRRIPAEIWRYNHQNISKLMITTKEIKSLVLDPHQETADVDPSNNHYPPKPVESRFRVFKKSKEKNLMQRMNEKRLPSGQGNGDAKQ